MFLPKQFEYYSCCLLPDMTCPFDLFSVYLRLWFHTAGMLLCCLCNWPRCSCVSSFIIMNWITII